MTRLPSSATSRTNDPQCARRALRAQIARLRRRIDRRVARLDRAAWLPATWYSWAERHPAQALVVGTGLGLLLGWVLRADRWLKGLDLRGVRQAVDRAIAAGTEELQSLWNRLVPEQKDEPAQAPTNGADHA